MALSNATRLSDFGSGIGTAGSVLKIDNANKRVGLGTTNPQAMVQVGQNITMDGGASGVITATKFVGAFDGTTGTFSGNLGVGGVLTYEDVTNIDSVGIITARAGINVTGGNINVTSGNVTVGGKALASTGKAIAMAMVFG